VLKISQKRKTSITANLSLGFPFSFRIEAPVKEGKAVAVAT
jgi:hypothetical protein